MITRLGELMARIATGDEDAFHLLYERLSDSVLAVCLSILRDPHEAQDIRQDTFLRVFVKAATFQGTHKSDASVICWVLTIARNRAIDQYHAQKREVPASDFIERHADLLLFDSDRLCEKLDLVALLDSIPADMREVVLLRVLGRLSHIQCAELLRVSVPTIKRRLRRAMTVLRVRYGQENSSPEGRFSEG